MSKIIQEAIKKYKPVHILLLFSGGHDSVTSTVYASAYLDSIGRSYTVYHGNTGIGISETRQYVQSIITRFSYPFYEGFPLPGDSYEEIVRQYGFPGPSAHRFMYIRLKEKPLRHYISHRCKSSRYARENVLLITGIRRSESKIRMGYKHAVHKQNSLVWCSPLFDWDERQCMTYMENNHLPLNPVKQKICISGECLCGAFAAKEEYAEIKHAFPVAAMEIDRLHQIAVENGHPWNWGCSPKRRDKKRQHSGDKEKMFMCIGCEQKNFSNEK